MFRSFKKWLSRPTPRSTRPAFRARIGLESLEDRRLLSGTRLDGGLLRIEGTAGNDTVRVSVVKDKIHVEMNGKAADFAQNKVKGIDFSGGAGNDTFQDDTALPCHAQGGAGDDRLTGGLGDDVCVGGTGHDRVNGDAGRNRDVGEVCDQDAHFEAVLTGPAGAAGKAEFNATTKKFELAVTGAAANATLDVSVDGTKVGTLTTDARGNGTLEVKQATFTVTARSTITVGTLSGTFAGDAVEQEQEHEHEREHEHEAQEFAAVFTGAAGASGKAEVKTGNNRLEVEVRGLTANQTFDVTFDGIVVGQVATDKKGRGEVRLTAKNVTVKAGSTVTIVAATAPALRGTFVADQ